MQNSAKLFFILILIMPLSSCENESTSYTNAASTMLVNIFESININNSPTSDVITYTIENDLNTDIEYPGGSNGVNTFVDGKMASAAYFYEGEQTSFETYIYDSNDRIISFSGSFPLNNQNITRVYVYDENQVTLTETVADIDGVVEDVSTYYFSLNSLNQIIRYQNEDNTQSWDASYTDGNLTGYTSFGYGSNVDGSGTFFYSSELASEPYQKERFRYGSEWRNNIMLVGIGNYPFKQLAELGKNYLMGYSFVRSSDGTEIISLNVSYEFDDAGRLSKQTKNKVFFTTPHDRVLTYVYQ